MSGIALNGRNRRIFRQLRLDSDRSSSSSPCVHISEDLCCERRSSETDHQGMAGGKFLASRPVRYHAGSHSFVLPGMSIPVHTAPELHLFLATSRTQTLYDYTLIS